MSGGFVKTWLRAQGMRPEELAFRLGVSIGTLYNLFKDPKPLDLRTELALAQLGCLDPNDKRVPPQLAEASRT